ncbi:MAG: LemA family protein [Patescibacteria group bacterium]
MNIPTILLGIGGLILLWAVFLYNRFVTLRNRVREAFSDIEVQLKRRYNLIPNLVETVKGYAAHEKGVLEKVTEARTRAMGARGMAERQQAENMLSETLKSLFAVVENYPDLKASTNFLELQRELRDTEDKIQASRRFYNTTVMVLNTMAQSFPSNLIAKAFRFQQEKFFEVETEAEREVPKVSF